MFQFALQISTFFNVVSTPRLLFARLLFESILKMLQHSKPPFSLPQPVVPQSQWVANSKLIWQAYGADLLISKIHIVPPVGLEPNTGISAQQIFLLLYITIAKQSLLPGEKLSTWRISLVRHWFIVLTLRVGLFVVVWNTLLPILKFLQDTIGILPSRGIGSYVTISFM